MIKLLWSGLFLILMLSGCGFDSTPTRQNDFTPLTSIQIIPASPSIATSKTIAMHTSTRLTVIGNFSGLFTRDITDQAVWSSDTPTVAEFITTANPDRVTGHIAGTAVLTATVGSMSSNFTLTVSPATITTMTVTPANPSVPKGLSTQFAVSGLFSDKTTQDLTFDASWSSSAPAIATVDDTAGNKGLAKALTVGASTITASFDGAKGTTLLTVTEAVLQSITVLPANPSILSLSSANFTATGNYSDGTTADLTIQASWAPSNSGIATIAANGAATALAQGTTSISATMNGVSGTTNLKVTGGTLTAITLSTPKLTPVSGNITLVKDTATQITATGTFGNGIKRDITSVVEWSSANTNNATIATPAPRNNLAWLNALAVTSGVAVTAKYGSITSSTNLAVTAPLVTSIKISPNILNMTAGTSDRLTVTATYNDDTTQDVTFSSSWTSGNNAVASVEDTGLAKGRVTGAAAGTANITATYGGHSDTCAVTVNARTLQSLAISGSPTVSIGNQAKFTATATYSDNTTKDVTENTTWAVSNQYVATFADTQNQPGQVVAVDTGSTILTATFGTLSQTVTITVP